MVTKNSRIMTNQYEKCEWCGENFCLKTLNQKYCGVSCSAYARESLKKRYPQQKSEKKQKQGWLALRFRVLRRDNFTCQYCGRDTKDNVKLQIDHIVPVIKGGKWVADNLITACLECNQGKKDVLLTEREISKAQSKSA